MYYQKYSPSPSLQPYVLCYFIWENHDPWAGAPVVQSPPNGLGGMVFNFGEPYQAKNDQGEWQQVPNSFLAGQFTKNYSLRLNGSLGMIGIAFLPAGLSKLLGVPSTIFTDQRIDLNLVLSKENAFLEQQVLESKTHSQRIAVLETFLFNKFCKGGQKADVIDLALDSIIQQKGILSITKLADDLCISSRQFRRRFIERVGISPKLLSRIKRFNYITNLSSVSSAKWKDLVYEGGYYDQAHFIRDFSEFSGKRPSDLINYNRELARLMGA